jgi:hypothetical protein
MSDRTDERIRALIVQVAEGAPTAPSFQQIEDSDSTSQPQHKSRLVVGVVAIVSLALIAGLLLTRTDDRSDGVRVGASSTTTTSSSATAPDKQVTSGGGITLTQPPGWTTVSDSLYSPLTNSQFTSITTASVSFPNEPAFDCDLPLAAVRALGPTDALVSIKEVGPGQATNATLPPIEDLLAAPGVDTITPSCTVSTPDTLGLRTAEFRSGKRSFLLYVAIGSKADDGRRSEVAAVLASLHFTN